jgi:hypothetical protein
MRHVGVDVDGVGMNVGTGARVVHASDRFGDREECFGGDTMGHWNVARINRILDACAAPVVIMPIPRANMLEMARVGKPDINRSQAYALLGAASMPPLSFVSFPDSKGGFQCMMVDGHHRMLAMHMLGVESVPARILPPELADDVRIIEIYEVAVFPEPQFPKKSVAIDAHVREVANV